MLVVTASSLEKRECRASFPLLNASFNFTAKFAYQKPHLRQLPAFRCISDKFRSKYCTSYIENEPMYLSYAYTIFVRDIFSLFFSSFFFFFVYFRCACAFPSGFFRQYAPSQLDFIFGLCVRNDAIKRSKRNSANEWKR